MGDSWLFGMIRDKRKKGMIREAVMNTKHPDLFAYLKGLIKTHDRTFKYTTINVNRNIKCIEHRDGSNIGESIIVGMGDYEDGEFVVKGRDYISIPALGGPPWPPVLRHDTEYNIQGNFVRFDGSQVHYTKPFKGTRISVVYFTMYEVDPPGTASPVKVGGKRKREMPIVG